MTVTAGLAGMTACHGLLDTTDPTLIRDSDITNASGAEGRRMALMTQWAVYSPRIVSAVALFTDERGVDAQSFDAYPYTNDWVLDARDSTTFQTANQTSDPVLGILTQVYWTSALAIHALEQYGAPATKNEYAAQTFAIRGHTVLQIAEDICSGFPLNDVEANDRPVLSMAITTDSALRYAVALFDSALVHGKDSTAFLDLARVLKGRALLDLGRYQDAAATVAEVPSEFVYVPDAINGGFNLFASDGQYSDPSAGFAYLAENREGENGLAFVAEHDSRVPTVYLRQRSIVPADSMFIQTKYPSQDIRIIVASGVEARLIEAEAAYNANNPSWFDKLNALRTGAGLTPVATMPATDTDRVNLIFHERAFWMYLTGHRLGDLRRLVRYYHRDPETIYPSGDYPIFGMKYGKATAIPFVYRLAQGFNPNITSGCAATP